MDLKDKILNEFLDTLNKVKTELLENAETLEYVKPVQNAIDELKLKLETQNEDKTET